ncbi:SusC/RagA family TonB-linked outer membrane protein [Mangrovibacterium sp.]|uniref:SusC/RagA family TonB-linked outer membrane protein n=1 Tax=Mangrovibacterium sp. TaxID=1961364 RepID=UPI003568054B
MKRRFIKSYFLLFILSFVCMLASAQVKTITGKVTGEDQGSIPGVTVAIPGTSSGTITDLDGKFSISVPSTTKKLVFSYIGLKTIEVDIAGSTTVNVVMEQDHIGLEEVVAVGYGVQKKSDLTGSVSSVKADEIIKVPMARVDQALQGKVTGMVVSNDKAQPGSSPVIRIRGDNSISGDNEPLVVIDGILGADMSILDPSEIESVEVLKDASAKAIYGSRGANGVIIITTKGGVKGKTQFDFAAYTSISKIANKLDLMTAEEQYNLLSDYPVDSDMYDDIQDLLAMYDPTNPEGTDWQDVVFQQALTQSYSLNASGGSDKTTFALSGSYYNQEGIITSSGYDRQTLRLRLDHKASDKLKIGTNLYLSKSNQDNTRADSAGGSDGGSVTQAANRFSPIIPVYDANGNYSSSFPTSSQLNNPAALIYERIDELKTFSATANLYAQYKIRKNLTLRSSYTSRFSNSWQNFWAGKDLMEALGTGEASIETVNNISWLNENTLTFDETYGKHHITAMAGITVSETERPSVEATSIDFPTEALKYNSLELGTPDGQTVESGLTESSMFSYLARINYVLASKYLFTANFRADGSSKFAENNKWGYFPSAALGWRMSEESWMKSIRQISNLKLRASIGSTGSQAISSYQSLASYSSATVPLGDSFYNALVSDRIPNPDLKWETTTEANVGFDFGMFDNRISLSADFYKKKTKDLLYSKNLPYYSGYASQTQNIGSIENTGLELALNTVNIDRKLKWFSSFNISFNKNEVVDLGGDEYQIYDYSGGSLGDDWREIVILKVGESLGNFFGYEFDGIYQNQTECDALPYPSGACEPGMIKLKDISGPDGVPDGQITADDRTIIGNGIPDFVFGFSNDFSYNGFDLNIMFQGSYGNEIFNLNRIKLERASYENGLAILLTEAWTGEGTSNTIQKINKSVGPANSRFVEDGSYIRLKNISLGYTIPSTLTKRLNISKLRFYISGQNLITITDYSGYDPEINSRTGNLARGIDYGGYPTAKTYTIGLNLGF